jgi:hypothetical protein
MIFSSGSTIVTALLDETEERIIVVLGPKETVKFVNVYFSENTLVF